MPAIDDLEHAVEPPSAQHFQRLVDESTVREWENGNHRPSGRHREQIEVLLERRHVGDDG